MGIIGNSCMATGRVATISDTELGYLVALNVQSNSMR